MQTFRRTEGEGRVFGLINLGICIFAAYRLHGTYLFIPSIINAIANFWGLGILHNYRDDPETPRIPGCIHILTSVGGLVLLIISFFLH